MPRNIVERANLVANAPLNLGGRTIFSKELPVGEGWHRLIIRFSNIVTVGTGTTPLTATLGQYQIIRNLLLKTDRGEQPVNWPGKAFYFKNWIDYGSPPRSTTLAAATGTYTAMLVIPFVDRKLKRPNDTILDTSRYSSVTLEINYGTIADLLGVPGTATMTATVDIDVVRDRGFLDDDAKPAYHIAYDFRQPVDASVTTSIDLEKSPDLSIKRIFVNATTSGTAGLPFYGTPSDAVLLSYNLKDQSSFLWQSVFWNMVRDDNAEYYGLEATTVAGIYQLGIPGLNVISFLASGDSLFSSLYTGDKSLLSLAWTNSGSPGANSIVTLATEGIRTLK